MMGTKKRNLAIHKQRNRCKNKKQSWGDLEAGWLAGWLAGLAGLAVEVIGWLVSQASQPASLQIPKTCFLFLQWFNWRWKVLFRFGFLPP